MSQEEVYDISIGVLSCVVCSAIALLTPALTLTAGVMNSSTPGEREMLLNHAKCVYDSLKRAYEAVETAPRVLRPKTQVAFVVHVSSVAH